MASTTSDCTKEGISMNQTDDDEKVFKIFFFKLCQ